MKPIESPSAFWKKTDKVFPTGRREQSIGLVPQSLLKPAVGWTGSGLFYIPGCLIVDFFSCFAVEIQKSKYSKRRPKC